MKEKLKALFIPLAVILSTVSWGEVAYRRPSVLHTLAAITPMLTIIAAAFAVGLAKKLKDKTAFLVNGVAFAVSAVAFLIGTLADIAHLRAAFGCTGFISAIGFVAFGVRLWKNKRPNGYKTALCITAGLLGVVCLVVAFSAIRFGASYINHGDHKVLAWTLMVIISVSFVSLAACLFAAVKRLSANKKTKRLGVAVALIMCAVLSVSSIVAVYYSPEIKATSVFRAQIGAIALGISGKDAVCIYDCGGEKVYLARREKAMEFRDTFEMEGTDFYTRMVDGVACKMESKGFMHFFRVLSFTPVE